MARLASTADYCTLIGETSFTQGRDHLEMALLDHGPLGVSLRLTFNRKFFFEQRFDEPAAAARDAVQRRRDYEASGWTVECQVRLAENQLAVDNSLAHAVAVG